MKQLLILAIGAALAAASQSSVPLVAVLSFVLLGMGLVVMFTRRPATAPLTPSNPESGLHRAQRAAAAASVVRH